MPRTLTVPDVDSSHRVRVALVAALVGGALVSCSSGGPVPARTATGPAPTVADTPSHTTAATPSPTSTPKPARPAAMDTVNLDGAIATATYFLQLFPYALNTSDLSEWKLLSHPECQFCAGLADEVQRQVALSEHQEGSATSIASATGTEVDPGVWFTVELDMTQGKSTVVSATGAVLAEGPSQRSHVTMVVVREGDQWLVRATQIDPLNA